MELEITPEPTPSEREALVCGLEPLLAARETALPSVYQSAWRQAGISEATAADSASARRGNGKVDGRRPTR